LGNRFPRNLRLEVKVFNPLIEKAVRNEEHTDQPRMVGDEILCRVEHMFHDRTCFVKLPGSHVRTKEGLRKRLLNRMMVVSVHRSVLGLADYQVITSFSRERKGAF
jgi:hypothetical protein